MVKGVLRRCTTLLYRITVQLKVSTPWKKFIRSLGLMRCLIQVKTANFSSTLSIPTFIRTVQRTLVHIPTMSWTVCPLGVLPLTTSICKGRVFWNGSSIPCRDEKDLKPVTEVYHVWYMFVPFYFCAVGIAFYFPYTVFRHLSGIYDIKPMLNTLTCNIEVSLIVNFVLVHRRGWSHNFPFKM